jgi:hypothetical protein
MNFAPEREQKGRKCLVRPGDYEVLKKTIELVFSCCRIALASFP